MVIQLDNVGKRFTDGNSDRWVLENLSFSIAEAESVAVIGPSGCGKTTLLNLLSGQLAIDAGTVEVCFPGKAAFRLNEMNGKALLHYRRSDIGFVYQFFNLIPTLTLKENVLLPVELTKRKHLRDQALSRIATLGLSDRIDAFPEELSGGEQQRAAIARALAHEPHIIFADEPTGNLDADNSNIVADLLWQEVTKSNATLVVATHSDAILSRANRVIDL